MPSAMWLVAALGGLEEQELRATFNGGLGMVAVVAPAAADALLAALPEAVLVGEVLPAAELGGRYVEAPLAVPA
jgi:phosphoribosylformylglycinamidine cyclo-ligase